MNNIYNSGWYV